VTELWWIIFVGLSVAVEIRCAVLIMRDYPVFWAWLKGGAVIAILIPYLMLLLIGPMAQIDPNLHGGTGTGIGFGIPMAAIVLLGLHTVIVLCALSGRTSRGDPPKS
jgi:hypothetical protein